MDQEDGEITESSFTACSAASETDYDPSIEWPGDGTPLSEEAHVQRKQHSLFRLVVSRSSVLPPRHRVALIDGYGEVQFGRDAPSAGVDTPRIRLKEMEVSKLHATVYWDPKSNQWNVVDMGSKHGTVLETSSSSVRLSSARTASMPRRLNHMDSLTMGSTTFVAHIHGSHLPCEECSPSGGDEIPLFSSSTSRRHKKALAVGSETYMPLQGRDAKKALANLRHNLLSRHSDPSPRVGGYSGSDAYVDRSARRRALHRPSRVDSPGITSVHNSINGTSTDSHSAGPSTRKDCIESAGITSQVPAPLPSSNIGHTLLMKQGWRPGTALGLPGMDEERAALVEPLTVSFTHARVGLGALSKDPPVSSPSGTTDWREASKRKRWESIR